MKKSSNQLFFRSRARDGSSARGSLPADAARARSRRALRRKLPLVFLAALIVQLAAVSLPAPRSTGQSGNFTITVTINGKPVAVPVSAGGSSVSGSLTWTEGATEHTTSINGTIEKGLNGKPRILVDVSDDWYRQSEGAGDPGT
jgi:hypothetical protein